MSLLSHISLRENLNLLIGNNKGIDKPGQILGLISILVVHDLENANFQNSS